MTSLIAQLVQTQRNVWLLLTKMGGSAEIPQEAINPLWELKYEKVEGKEDTVRLIASTLPVPTEEQLEKLANKLRGKRTHPGDAMTEVGLAEHPYSYVVKLLSTRIVIHEGAWIDRAEFDKLPKKPPAT
jgi:hypothetical protein